MADPKRAAEFVSVGKRAHRLGKYRFAIHAFKQARQIEPTPPLLFSIANAYHQRFLVNHEAFDRVQAILHYQEYLRARPRGRNSERAGQALAHLAGVDQAIDDEAMAKAAAAETTVTRLAVTSSVMGAVARIDGQKARALPTFVAVEPGKHSIVVSAAGYRKIKRRLEARRGFLYPVHVRLEPAPAKLTLESSDGAEVLVDGRFVGLAPIEEPIEVAAGTRQLAVTLNGHLPYTDQVTLEPGASHQLEADLSMTKQRAGAIFLITSGAAAIGTGIGFGIASTVAAPSADEELPPDEQKARQLQSDDFRVVSAMAVGVGLGLSAFGGTLFVFDEPKLSLEARGPGSAGATMRLRF